MVNFEDLTMKNKPVICLKCGMKKWQIRKESSPCGTSYTDEGSNLVEEYEERHKFK